MVQQNILQKRSRSVRIIFFLGYVLFVYLLILYTVQDDLIFHPDAEYVAPNEAGAEIFHEHPVQMRDGTVMTTWFAEGRKDKPAVLFFHGNAGQISKFASPLSPLIQNGYAVMMAEYRGFGGMAGKITEKDTIADATTLFDYLSNHGYSKIVAFGYSFGSAPAIALTTLRPTSGLILMAPFTSLEDMVARTNLPFARYLLKDGYYSDQRMKGTYVPILLMHGGKDKIIPPFHSERLNRLSPSLNKKMILNPDETHSSLFYSGHSMPIVLKWLSQLK